jgi:hypothetical protein
MSSLSFFGESHRVLDERDRAAIGLPLQLVGIAIEQVCGNIVALLRGIGESVEA